MSAKKWKKKHKEEDPSENEILINFFHKFIDIPEKNFYLFLLIYFFSYKQKMLVPECWYCMIYPPLRIAIVFISILTCFAFIQSHTMHAPVSIKMYEFEIRTNWQGFAATKQPNRDRNEDNNDTNSIHTHFKTDIYKFKLTPTKGKKNVDFFSVNIFLAKVIKKIVMNWCKLRYFMASTQPFVTPFVSVVSYWLTANALIYGLLILLHHTIYWVYLHCLHKWMDFICIICWCLIRQFKCYMMILSVQSIHLPQYITNGICHCLPLNFFEFPLM